VDLLIRFLPSQRSVRAPLGTTLLEATRSVGLPMASACGEEGACGRCGLRILEGVAGVPCETPRESQVKARNRVPKELRLACQVRPERDVTVTAPYW
jgi:adenylate cyclase